MENIGIDVHKGESQICILKENGEIIERRIRTERERFATVLGKRGPAKILIEASTESEWVTRCLESLGYEIVVADPNFASMYATRSRKVKTDRRRPAPAADRVAGEGAHAVERLEERDAEAEQVSPRFCRLAAHLLGRHVRGAAHHRPGPRQRRGQRVCAPAGVTMGAPAPTW
jgi:transposase